RRATGLAGDFLAVSPGGRHTEDTRLVDPTPRRPHATSYRLALPRGRPPRRPGRRPGSSRRPASASARPRRRPRRFRPRRPAPARQPLPRLPRPEETKGRPPPRLAPADPPRRGRRPRQE